MGFFYSQLVQTLPYPSGSWAGKTVIITGSNVGLGKEAARHFVRLGVGRLILAVRSIDKGEAAKADIQAGASDGAADQKSVVEVWKLDMASYASVQAFAARVDRDLDRVDVVLANAGIAPTAYAVAEDNEQTITVNVVSTFLLAALVMPKLKASAAEHGTRPTLTFVSSAVHAFTSFAERSAPRGRILETVGDRALAEKRWAEQYPISKLLGVFGARALAERRPASVTPPVTVNLVHPGMCHSELARDSQSWGFWLWRQALSRSTEYGSRTLVHAASQGADSHGQYLADCAVAAPAPLVTSPEGREAQERVWEEIVAKLEAIQPGVTDNF
ncbi:hypothetical protein HIM_06417 [Hirsutella minnesotensis 3608]|uniref:Uncharacterized protein n=1 Tax=Hirsutella minnesotensis 3608 TaxID=1043627 RepID=A0A0F7ZJ71_9HYPO|nr:hypothetical protein HIM_06417 [Hirsutella minnesotensis 3608]